MSDKEILSSHMRRNKLLHEHTRVSSIPVTSYFLSAQFVIYSSLDENIEFTSYFINMVSISYKSEY